MDFAKFATEYLNQQTEGDPSFMVSEEALAFVDLMRKDDLDRRAAQATQATNPNNRGEPTHEEVSDSVVKHPQSTPGNEPDFSEPFQGQPEDTMPAAPASEVALRPDTLQASDSLFNQSSLAPAQDATAANPIRESGVDAERFEAVRDDGPEPEPFSPFSAESLPANADVATIDQRLTQDVTPTSAQQFQEQHEDSEPESPVSETDLRPDTLQVPDSLFSQNSLLPAPDAAVADPVMESGNGAEPSKVVQDDGQDSEPTSEFSADSLSTDPELAAIDQLFSATNNTATLDAQFTNQSLQSEGVTVTEINSGHNETVILQPESLPDFNAMLRSFDKDYRPPDTQVGDDMEIPPPPELSDNEPMESSTEFAESMVAEMSEDFLNSSRRKP